MNPTHFLVGSCSRPRGGSPLRPEAPPRLPIEGTGLCTHARAADAASSAPMSRENGDPMPNRMCSLFVKVAALSVFVVTGAGGCGGGGSKASIPDGSTCAPGSATGSSGMTGIASNSSTQQYWASVASSSDGTNLVAVAGGVMVCGKVYSSSYCDSVVGGIMVGGYIYTSTDSGATWTLTTAPQQLWQSVASSSDGTKLVAAGYTLDPDGNWVGGYVYRSSDSGATWTQTGPQQEWKSVASSADGTKLVAVVSGYLNAGYIYTSADSGATWTQTGTRQGWWSVASSSDGTKLVAVAGGIFNVDYIYTSADSGATWTQTGTRQGWWSVASSSDGMKLVAAAYLGDIYASTDSGATWKLTTAPPTTWTSVASSSDGTRLVAVDNSGDIYTSTDSGATWTLTTAPQQLWQSVASSSDGMKLVAVSDNMDDTSSWYVGGDIYTSADSGATWPQSQ